VLSLGVFGITDGGLNLAANLLLLCAVVVWLALVYWTYADARRRIDDPLLVGCATAAALFPVVGTLVYTIVRPPEYLDDVRERELEIVGAEERLAALRRLHCPYCDAPVGHDFLRCPACLHKLKDACPSCSRPLETDWRLCPYCERERAEPAPAPGPASQWQAETVLAHETQPGSRG